ncbi:hypothetical protein GTZ99_10525 [Novosphingobium sp. FSY-8]|uniref:Uncharacterized protein n=1 Tax=Novosphingobium ovatum TaxID=1908523 RepID=A0ABW9XEN4_9SPHN|nr:hypothetical protein [Novosphingobium ovatum]NBC36990.1 hypothetical protein [Novosphingobium ovatum]
MTRLPLMIAAALALIAPVTAMAQGNSCNVAGAAVRQWSIRPDASTITPQQQPITSYTFALTWSPQFCADNAKQVDTAFQCGGGNRFGFVVHGLWPEGPRWCSSQSPAIADMQGAMCTTPSSWTLTHEWLKHGSCAFARPADYYAKERALFAGLRMPNMAALAARGGLTAGALRNALVAGNPALRATQYDSPRGKRFGIGIKTAGDRMSLREVTFCLDPQYRFIACRGAAQGAWDDDAIRIQPVPAGR